MTHGAELELVIRGLPTYVEARLSMPDRRIISAYNGKQPILFDQTALLANKFDPHTYGRLLTQTLFSDAGLKDMWVKARSVSDSVGAGLCIRLDVRPDELYALHWETLLDPDQCEPVALSQRLLFARTIDVVDIRPIPRVTAFPHTVAAVAAPSDLADFGLAPVDVEAETARVQKYLGRMSPRIFARSTGHRPTLAAITAELHAGAQVLYVVAHGQMIDGEHYLWLEQPDGRSDRVAGEAFAAVIRGLSAPPLLIVLCSCFSAGSGESGSALAALGPQLVRAGAVAVVAMQGPLLISSAAELMPALFTELQRDGQIDRALAAARHRLRGASDWWAPTLLTRLRDGQLWMAPPAQGSLAGPLDYEHGLAELARLLEGAQAYLAELAVLADRLRDNLRKERLFGSSETRRAERSEVIYALNALAFRTVGKSFNDLC
jgi:hypothetical protein